MREESHLDDMRSAIRGDFERLAERRGGQELMRPREEPPEPDSEPAATDELAGSGPLAEPAAEAVPHEPLPALEDEAPEEPVPEEPAPEEPAPEEPAPEPAPEEPRRRSWLDRLLGR
jgi:hypothetical protein